MKVVVAFDHRGVTLRERLLGELAELGHEVVDLGTDAREPRVDYPDKAREVGEAIRAGDGERGILVCGSGVGASVAANKLRGIRAALCHDVYSAHQGVEHDDMNVICLGSEVIGAELAAELVRAFLAAEFRGGERYVRRLEKVAELEREAARAATIDSPSEKEGARAAAIGSPDKEGVHGGTMGSPMIETMGSPALMKGVLSHG